VKYVLALDQGTTSSRAIVFDEHAAARSSAQKEFPQIYPQPGWVEHDPEQVWRSQLTCAKQALARARIGPGDVTAIGITNQRETTVVWERATGKPIHHAIVWQDRRTAAACERLRSEGWSERVRAKTGLVMDPYFSATKLAWILDHVPGARPRAERGELAFGTIDTWLAWKLSGGALHITDVSNASRTLLYDIHAHRWDEELLALFGVPAAMLPEVRASSEVYGHCQRNILGAEIPIAGIAGDQQAALFGQG
jgi:glycerol kinase